MSTLNAFDISVFAHKITLGTSFTGTLFIIPPITNALSELIAASVTIVTNAVVQNRRLKILLREGSVYFPIAISPVLHPQSTKKTYIIGQHGSISPPDSTDEIIYIPLPSIPMAMETHSYHLSLFNAAADVWSEIHYCQKFWIFEQ